VSLGRACQTARIIADVVAVESSIIIDPDLMEIGMGSAEGMTQAEMEQRWPASQADPASETMSLQSPDGEALEALAERLAHAALPIIMQQRASSCPTALPAAYSVRLSWLEQYRGVPSCSTAGRALPSERW
jgi:broad specificity phosphatase PhoE